MSYLSTKTYNHNVGLSCCFRQWRATHSHCSLIHGYSVGFRFVFEADTLDERNWVYDFGNCKWIKEYLESMFDHTLVIAADDPLMADFENLHEQDGCKLLVMDGVGCEKFSQYVYHYVSARVENETGGRVKLKSVEVFEHGANSAIYVG